MVTALNEIIVTPNGTLWSEVFRGVLVIPDMIDQAYFWTSTWQAWEEEADRDLSEGQYADFSDIDSLLDDLHSSESSEE